MPKTQAPAFQFYPRDVLSDAHVAAMSLEEFGAYMKLVSYCWLETALPNDMKRLARILGISHKKMLALWSAIAPLFNVEGDTITHPELDKARQRQEEWRRKSAEGGRKSAQVRGKGGSSLVASNDEPDDEANAHQTPTLHTASASSSASSSAHTHTSAVDESSVCAGSKFSYEQCLAYAKHLHATGQGIDKPVGFAKSIHRSGADDVAIEAFINSKAGLSIRERREIKQAIEHSA